MILLDLSHIAISNVLADYKSFKGEIDENLFKHMILTSISNYKQKFQNDFGELIICCDSKTKSWRKQQFQHYKANRKKDNSFVDWTAVYSIVESIIEDLKQFFPYKVIRVDGAEGDDIIAVLAKQNQPNVVVSNDKDFIQLLKYKNVKVYSTREKTFKNCNTPQETLLEHIISGDVADGIPNVKSIEQSFVAGKRQISIRKVVMREQWIPEIIEGNLPEDWDGETRDRFKQNQRLIDFEYIPEEIQQKILDEYSKPPIGTKKKVMEYFVKNRMRNLLAEIHKF